MWSIKDQSYARVKGVIWQYGVWRMAYLASGLFHPEHLNLEVPEFLLNRVLEYRTPYRVGRLCQCIPKMSQHEIQ